MTRQVLLRCDSTWDLYPVTAPSPIPYAFFVSQHTWHQHLGHPGGEMLRPPVSFNFISYNKEKPPFLCHAYQTREASVCSLGYVDFIHSESFRNALLHGDLSETVYMHQPLGIQDSVHPDYVCLLQRFLYGLKHPLELCFSGLHLILLELVSLIVAIIRSLHQEFAMTDLGPLNYFLGSDGDPVFDSTLYRSLTGSLQHLTFTRPDISYAVQQDYGLQLFSSSTEDLVAYSDADWAGFPTTLRSTLCYCVFLGNNLISWSSKRELMLSRSSAEAEYCGVANRMKHNEIDIHFVRDLVAAGQVRVLHVPPRYQFADIFTKGLPLALFEEFRSS
uniref:Uncharacterized protein n=1 Tax=Tanacetum cinerariifolium TaxID=118510 RepID=A0A6L2P4C1_TANCI|nr:hypothetical protein [Tanacetum cinerariifolium]